MRQGRNQSGIRKQAFQIAASVGFAKTEESLRKYAMLPEAFFTQPSEYFSELRQHVLNIA
jgi:hypothetical protein